MTDVFTILRADHDEVKAMLALLESSPVTRGAAPDELARRKGLVDELVIAQSRHEAAEQQVFWPAVQALGADGARIAEQAIEQEEEGERVLDHLSRLGAGHDQSEALLAAYINAARSHIVFEEAHAWPLISAEITQARAEELGEEFARVKKMAPTRPHPGIPAQGGAGQRAAATVAAAADRLRDAVTGRGRR
jgi:hemerythrin-like domain-containing protein